MFWAVLKVILQGPINCHNFTCGCAPAIVDIQQVVFIHNAVNNALLLGGWLCFPCLSLLITHWENSVEQINIFDMSEAFFIGYCVRQLDLQEELAYDLPNPFNKASSYAIVTEHMGEHCGCGFRCDNQWEKQLNIWKQQSQPMRRLAWILLASVISGLEYIH